MHRGPSPLRRGRSGTGSQVGAKAREGHRTRGPSRRGPKSPRAYSDSHTQSRSRCRAGAAGAGENAGPPHPPDETGALASVAAASPTCGPHQSGTAQLRPAFAFFGRSVDRELNEPNERNDRNRGSVGLGPPSPFGITPKADLLDGSTATGAGRVPPRAEHGRRKHEFPPYPRWAARGNASRRRPACSGSKPSPPVRTGPGRTPARARTRYARPAGRLRRTETTKPAGGEETALDGPKRAWAERVLTGRGALVYLPADCGDVAESG